MMPRSMFSRRKLALAALTTVLLLLGAEGWFRWVEPVSYRKPLGPIPAEKREKLVFQHSDIPGLLYELAPNKREMAFGKLVETNSFGMRGDEPRTGDSAPQFRIATVGDSFTFGHSVLGEHCYPEVLEQILDREEAPGRFEVLNFGVSGYTTQQEALVLEHKVLQWDPQLVVLGYYLNDPETDPMHELHQTFEDVKWWQHSHLLRLFAKSKVKWDVDRHGDGDYISYLHYPDGEKWKSVTTAFADIQRLTSERDIPVVLVIFPRTGNAWAKYPSESIHRQVEDAARAAGMDVIDLLPAYSKHRPLELMVSPSNNHPNPLGHRIAAQAIFEWIEQHKAEVFE